VRETLIEGTEGALHLGSKRPRVYSDLTSEEKDRYNADIRATNILLQGLPKDIYSLINHYTDAKDIWDNVKMLLEGSKLTKEDCESQLFVTSTKLNKGLKDFNYDQLYAYLKQHEETHSEADCTFDFRALDFQITPLTGKVSVLQEQNELFRVENAKFKQHYKEIYDSIKITRAKHIDQTTTLLTKNDNLKVQINAKLKYVTIDFVTPKVLTPGMYAIDVEPIPPCLRNKREVHLDYLKHLKESVATLREIVKEAKVERPLDRLVVFACLYTKHSQKLLEYVVHIILWYLDSGCSKHMTWNRSWLRNFMKKFIEIVRFENGHFGAIMGYGDYVIGDSVISRNHLFYVCDTDGVKLIKGSRSSNLCTILVEDMMKSFPICLFSKASKTKPWLCHCRLNHLNFGTINDLARKDLVRGLPRLKFEKDHLCFACQLGKSKKHTNLPKAENTNLEVLNTLHVDLCEPMRMQKINGKKYILVIGDDYTRFTWVKFLRWKYETPKKLLLLPVTPKTNLSFTLVITKPHMSCEDLGKLQPTADIGIFIGYAPSRKYMTRSYIFDVWTNKFRARTKSGSCSTLCTPANKDLEILFQPMFDEYLEPPRVDRSVSPASAVLAPVNLASIPSYTAIHQDAHSPSHSPSSSALQSPCLHQGVAAESTLIDENPFAPVHNDPFIKIFALEPTSATSSSGDASSANSTYVTQTLHHLEK
nr:hypothetical protein [Tanacetum cinerariifolium]